ncbi:MULTISPECIES: RNA-binding protein [Haloferax]|uniref:RNA-binding protein n=1 Tax=Haloferax marinum TaxID=2666143 RepID=A0A6A8G4A0_9EURY|nr:MULTISPECIES: RNA-binding protein [Haloferax]KAB1196525.1 RNA-binding protein [Haloferax sp. CBA1150]MRW95527.1 RNA-binding protein [Haloferax marinum]
MPRVPFHYIDLRTFCYETEDEKRVEEALRTFLPDDFEVDRIESTGHHGDRIVVFSARAERADDVRHILSKIRELPDFEGLLDELDDRVTDNTEFFLRLDKQAAFKGEARRGGGITLRAKVEAYPAKKEAAVKNAREALLGDE